MKKQYFSIAIAAAVLTFAACTNNKKTEETINVDTTVTMVDTTPKVEEQGIMVGGAMMVPSKNIVENALGSNEHTTLVTAVKTAGLDSVLQTAGPFTVFAPTDSAFAKLPAGTVENLMKPEKKADLTSILTYHVVAGKITAADLTDGQKLTTVNGQELTVSVKDGKVMLKSAGGTVANITIGDVISSNGITHVVDAVLLPASPKGAKKAKK